MLFQITSVGLQVAANAQAGGPKITITQYKIGDGYGYTPSASATGLQGTTLYTNSPSNYIVQSDNSIIYTLLMDTTVGDFNFGEIGLYLDTGELFALATTSSPVAKTSGVTGNVVSIDAVLQLTNIAPVVNFYYPSSETARLAELVNINHLSNPTTAGSNAYITGSVDDGNNYIYAFSKTGLNEGAKWTFPTHALTVVANGAIATATQNSLTSTNIGNLVSNPVSNGKYVIQFLDGPLRGLCRILSSAGTNTVSWSAPFGQAPLAGNRFDVYVSNYSVMANIQQIADDSLVNAIVLGGDL